ncbi:MAG: T9SS type A sorting domain-containing protein [Bacteroidota bacterium]
MRLAKAVMFISGMTIIALAQPSFTQSQNNQFKKIGTSVEEPVLLLTLKDRWEEAWLGSPAIADIDKDGEQEIIVPRANALVVWNADGSLSWKFNDTPGRIFAGAVVADFRDDALLEIAFAAADQVFMLDANGNVLSGFPVTWENEIRSLAAGDVDGDGELDLVAAPACSSPADVMNAWHADGSQVEGFPPNSSGSSGCDQDYHLAGCYDQNIAIGDLDGDEKMDIVVPHDNAYASFHKGSGEAFDANAMFQYCTKTPGVRYLHDLALAQQGWTNNENEDLQSGFANTAPAIADVDGDGTNEIVLLGHVQNASGTDLRKGVALWVVRPDASRIPGWETPFHVPDYLAGRWYFEGTNIVGATNQVAVADINPEKPGPEFIFAGFDGKIHAVAFDKSELWSFNYTSDTTVLTGGVVVGDLSGDNIPEIVFNTYSTEDDKGALFVLDASGNELHRVPLPRRGAMPVPTLADVDNNGTAEIAVSLKDADDQVESVLIYTVASSSVDNLDWPTGRGNLLRNGWWVNPDTGPDAIQPFQEDPLQYRLFQNHPNPFNASTRIRFYLPGPDDVTIEVYNTLGRSIKTLIRKQLYAGHHEVTFNAQDLPGGVYLYRIQAGAFQDAKKMTLMK